MCQIPVLAILVSRLTLLPLSLLSSQWWLYSSCQGNFSGPALHPTAVHVPDLCVSHVSIMFDSRAIVIVELTMVAIKQLSGRVC